MHSHSGGVHDRELGSIIMDMEILFATSMYENGSTVVHREVYRTSKPPKSPLTCIGRCVCVVHMPSMYHHSFPLWLLKYIRLLSLLVNLAQRLSFLKTTPETNPC